MKQIIYAMQFVGSAAPKAGSPTILTATTTALSGNITTVAGPEGVSGRLETTGGGKATFTSEVTITGETSFRESGTIQFGDERHRLHFSTVGEGYLNASADPRLKHGTVTWRLDSGEGQFAGASGLNHVEFHDQRDRQGDGQPFWSDFLALTGVRAASPEG